LGLGFRGFSLIVLSMQLRKSKAAALWTPSLDHLALIGKEQRAAKATTCKMLSNESL